MIDLKLHQAPPSFNEVGHSGSRWTWTKTKKQWQRDIETALLVAGVPRGLPGIKATATIFFHTKRRRDEGNYRVLLEKCLGDALVNGGWLADDTPEYYEFAGVSLQQNGTVGRAGLTYLHLEVSER